MLSPTAYRPAKTIVEPLPTAIVGLRIHTASPDAYNPPTT